MNEGDDAEEIAGTSGVARSDDEESPKILEFSL